MDFLWEAHRGLGGPRGQRDGWGLVRGGAWWVAVVAVVVAVGWTNDLDPRMIGLRRYN